MPRLEVVEIHHIRFHEEVDLARVAALVERLGADRALRHPPIVARLPGTERLLLDGANRIEALIRMGIRHALVQTETLDDPALRLSRWNHVIRRRDAKALVSAPPPGIRPLADGAADPTGRPPLCTLLLPDGREIRFLGPEGLLPRAAALREIATRHTHPRARLDRIAHRDLEQVRLSHPEFGGVLVYSDVSKDQVLRVAAASGRLPSGVTRFLVPHRVLGFNLPLAFLQMDLPLREKRRRLAGLVAERFDSGRVRYYAEPVFVFDD